MTLAEPAAAPVDAARHALEMVETIPLPLIDPSPYQPRQVFADEPLAELAASLAAHGLQQPITVRWGPEQQRYELLAGERRLRAAQQLGWETIPALVRDVDDAGAATLVVIENLHRQDLNVMEIARAYQAMAETGLKQAEIARRVGREQPEIAKFLGLLRLPEDVQQLIAEGRLTRAHGVALARFSRWPKLQSAIASAAAEFGAPAKQLEKGLPLSSYLSSADGGPIRYMSRDGTFPACKECPLNARIATSEWSSYCLEPAHWRELDAMQAAERKAEEAQRPPDSRPLDEEVLQAANGTAVRLPYQVPAGCSEACPCRLETRDRWDRPQLACTDAARLRTLQDAENARATEERDRRVQAAEAQRAAACQRLDALELVGPNEMALLVCEALRGADGDIVEAEALRHGIVLSQDDWLRYWNRDGDVDVLAKLAQYPARDLARWAIASMHLADLDLAERYGAETPFVDWYMAATAPPAMPYDGDSPFCPRCGKEAPPAPVDGVEVCLACYDPEAAALMDPQQVSA